MLMSDAATSHDIIKDHVRVDGCHEERFELFHFKFTVSHVAGASACTVRVFIFLTKPLSEEVCAEVPLNNNCRLLLKFVD
jgi:hypothetical protein